MKSNGRSKEVCIRPGRESNLEPSADAGDVGCPVAEVAKHQLCQPRLPGIPGWGVSGFPFC